MQLVRNLQLVLGSDDPYHFGFLELCFLSDARVWTEHDSICLAEISARLRHSHAHVGESFLHIRVYTLRSIHYKLAEFLITLS